MKKSWVMLLVIALVGVLATAAYAEQFMVIVLDLGPSTAPLANPAVVQCFGANQATPDNANSPSQITLGANSVKCGDSDKHGNSNQRAKITMRRQGAGGGNVTHDLSLPDHTVLISNSPGCVTYTYGGHSYTICN